MSKLIIVAAVVGLVVASSAIAAPKHGNGNSQNSPGHLMQSNGSVPGYPGASGYAPGHVKKMKKVRNARAYAPRHRTTTGTRINER